MRIRINRVRKCRQQTSRTGKGDNSQHLNPNIRPKPTILQVDQVNTISGKEVPITDQAHHC